MHNVTVKQSSKKRPSSSKLPFGWAYAASLVGLAALVLAGLGAGEPFWVDELHTSWVVSGGLENVPSRAAAGNQSVWYFYLVYAVRQVLSTVGDYLPDGWLTEELALRLPSMLAWSLSVALLVVVLMRDSAKNREFADSLQATVRWKSVWKNLPIIGWSLCLLLDRLQWFYGVEARVYSFLQLLNLVGWLIVASIARQGAETESPPPPVYLRSRLVIWPLVAWTLMAVAMIHLHITSVLSVLTQLSVLGFLGMTRPQIRLTLVWCVVVLLGSAGWMLGDLQPLWDRRMQWRAIGGDGTWRSLVQVLPILPLLVPVIVAGVVHQFAIGFGFRRLVAAGSRSWIWAIAFTAPLLSAWGLTRLEIAPLFHYRFVMTAALPLALFSGYCLLSIPSVWLRWCVVAASLVWLAASQGTLQHWQRGHLISASRNEDWKQAAEYISERMDPERDSLWCSAGLIEGQTAAPPLSLPQNEYLSYPLRGAYRVVINGKPVEPSALVGKSTYWKNQVDLSPKRAIWIACRGNSKALEKRLQQAGMAQFHRRYPIVEFGRVSTVCLQAH